MQFVFNEDNNLYNYLNDEDDFKFPSNIKQIGSIEDDIKIYMEDYVFTYLHQYAKSGGNEERLAILMGKFIEKDDVKYVVISGAIQGKYTQNNNGTEQFTEDSWKYIKQQMDTYFSGLIIVGWVHTQPGYGAFLMSKDEEFHKAFFLNGFEVLFVIDPLDKDDAFFIFNRNKKSLRESKGYFIYYDKNERMQDYMIENSLVRTRTELEEEQQRVFKENEVEFQRNFNSKAPENDRMDAAKKIRGVLRKHEQQQNEKTAARYTLLAGVSAALCISCLTMGISILNSQDRIKRLETEISSVKTSYKDMEKQIEDTNTKAVFATEAITSMNEASKNKEETEKEETESKDKIKEIENKKESEKEENIEEVKPVQQPNVEEKPIDIYVVESGDTL